VLHIEGRTFPVTAYYLEDAIEQSYVSCACRCRKNSRMFDCVRVRPRSGYICTVDSDYAKLPENSYSGKGDRFVSGGGKHVKGGGKRSQALSAAAEGYARAAVSVDPTVFDKLAKEYPRVSERTLSSLAVIDEEKVNVDLIEELLRHIVATSGDGAILVFLPGLMEVPFIVAELWNMFPLFSSVH
jgi:HrpA-like RNA helicase